MVVYNAKCRKPSHEIITQVCKIPQLKHYAWSFSHM